MGPLISVLIPCYNQGRFLRRAIESIRAQTYRNWECIILNDGSTDDTRAVAELICSDDSRILYLEHRNRGLAATRNRGLDIASGAFIQFLDSDDTIAPQKLEIQLALLESNIGPSLAFCDYHFCDSNNETRVIKRGAFDTPNFIMDRALCDLAWRWETELSIPIHCFLFDARIFRNTGIRFDETLPNHEDWECWMRVFATNPTICKSSENLATYMVHDESMSVKLHEMWRGFHMACLKLEHAFRDDTEVHTLLLEKRSSIRMLYKRRKAHRAWDRLPKKLTDAFKNNVPWPIQRLVFWIFGF